MGEIRWIILSAIAVIAVNAAPRELNSDELITEPRPGEEYVNIQTGGPPFSPQKVDLQGNSFTTSHRISQPKPKFETAHKIKSEANQKDALETAASDVELIYDEIETTTSDVPVEVVTRTSVKMSKSKKVQKPVAKDVKLDIKSAEGIIDERKNADEEERKIMAKKFSTEIPKPSAKALKFNVPFEDDETETAKAPHTATTPEVTTPAPTTTEEPPITTFNYKNIYDKSKKTKEVIEIIPENNEKVKQEKYKYETVANEALKTAESRNNKKDTKQEKKHHEIQRKEDVGFEVVPVNKAERKLKEDNFDFFDADEKVLVPAGSSPGQSSRINIKKGPNGQDYEYEYVYYYYDEDEDGTNGTVNLKEGKVVQTTTTERVYNSHDGPAKEGKTVQTSTNGNKYLPTEAPKTTQRPRTSVEYEEVEYEEEDEKELKPTRGGSNSNRYTNINRHNEPVSNEVLPATTRATPRTRGRISIPGAHAVPVDDIPTIADERLPANTRFPPRSRSNNVATSPQPVETTVRSRARENTQTRGRVPVDSSVFRTQSSDTSSEEEPVYETELQRRPPTRQQVTTESKYEEIPRRGTRPTTVSTTEEITSQEIISARRPTSRKPDDRIRHKPVYEVQEEEEERTERISGNARRPETTRESDSEEGFFEVTKTPYSSIQRPSTEIKSNDITTEHQSVGLTSASMEKVAFDLYAILQQAQNENIRANLVENATDVTTDAEEGSTEFSTTTTTTTEPTTTSTTTTTPAPVPTGRGRYKTRGGTGVGPSKTRTRQPSVTSSTAEPATEASSPRTRGRFHSTHNNRASNHISSRRPTTSKVEETPEDGAVKEEVNKQSAEKSFGERPSRNKYRTSGRISTSTTTTAPAAAPAATGSRSSTSDRYNTRRRGSRPSSTTQQPSNEEVSAEEKQDSYQASKVTEETGSTPSLRPRARVPTSGARPLRPGPRVPLTFPRGRTTTTTQASVEAEEEEKEAPTAEEQRVPQVVEEVQEQPTTPASTPSRLKNRPRVRYNPTSPSPRSQGTPISNRRSLLSPPRRKGTEEKPIEKNEEEVVIEEEKTQEEHEEEVASPSTEASSTTAAEPENKGLSGLLPGRRRPNRKPGTIFRKQTTEAP